MKEVVLAFLLAHKDGLITAGETFAGWILVSLYNGSRKYPVWHNLLGALIDRLSFATHKDSPGTWKLPGTESKNPDVQSLEFPKEGGK